MAIHAVEARDAWLEKLQTAHPHAKWSFHQRTSLMFLLSAVSSSMVECGGAALGAGKPADTCLAQPRGAVTMFKSI